VVVVVVLSACAGPVGLRHRVERGESLYRISTAYGVSPERLARANGLGISARLEEGQVIVIPHANRELPVSMITPERARADQPAPPELPGGPSPFQWPVLAGVLTSDFGPRGASHHDGIDIGTPEGTPVRAARAGRILFSDRLRGYGNLIIIEHEKGYATVYAHNRENHAEAGTWVKQGEVIASVGRTGKTSGPNLHFEIRQDNVARDPLYYLPAAKAARRPTNVVQTR
jgi:murein DD-endopeptidase MepM/ murein hydrolase activator NlpD